MKILRTLFILFLSISSYAQTMEINGKTYKKGDRIETANVTPYEGIWEWKDNNQFFKLKLYKRVVDFAGNKDYTMEVLLGQYQYKINEVEKYNSVNDTTRSNLAAGNIQDGKLIFFITDGTTKFRGKGTMELLDSGKMRWHITPKRPEWRFTKDQIMSFSIPLEMILSRQP
ncbi:DUF6705 family protein [Pedobacter sp. SAFR-022]|uniref:DUF6705 family protein n=1 Tax=Pedobacter sp. SAFR-022 TaxID=3436861 RepID=UPI003F7DAC64